MPKTYKGAELRDCGLRIHPIAYKAIQQKALDYDVPAAQLIRDVLYVWLGYAINPDDPVYSRLGEIPGVEELYPGYAMRVDLFGAERR